MKSLHRLDVLSAAGPLLLVAILLSASLPASAQLNPAPPAAPAPAQPAGTVASLIDRATQTSNSFGEQIQLLAAFLAVDPQIEPAVGKALQVGPEPDRQNGATSEASGTTTLTEKPGLAELLNLAIENGAIVKTTSGTSVTLQTTPYLLYSRFGAWDTAQTWDSLPALRRISLSATFDQGTSDSDTASNNLQKGEIKYTWGARSPRDKVFRDRLRPILASTIDLDANRANSRLFDFYNGLTPAARKAFDDALIQFNDWRRPQKAIDCEALIAEVQKVTEPVRKELRDADLKALDELNKALDAEGKAFANASQRITEEAKLYLEEPHRLYSVAYSFQRDPKITDFSDIKVIFGYNAGSKLTVNLNGEVMINNNGTAVDGTKLDRVRGYSLAGDLTLGKFAKGAADFTLAAKLTRPEGEAHDVASAQAKLNLYLARGITIPVALTYSNRTDTSNKSRVRLNVGLSLTADTLMGAAKGNT